MSFKDHLQGKWEIARRYQNGKLMSEVSKRSDDEIYRIVTYQLDPHPISIGMTLRGIDFVSKQKYEQMLEHGDLGIPH